MTDCEPLVFNGVCAILTHTLIIVPEDVLCQLTPHNAAQFFVIPSLVANSHNYVNITISMLLMLNASTNKLTSILWTCHGIRSAYVI